MKGVKGGGGGGELLEILWGVNEFSGTHHGPCRTCTVRRHCKGIQYPWGKGQSMINNACQKERQQQEFEMKNANAYCNALQPMRKHDLY
jgi:hypothetical protein